MSRVSQCNLSAGLNLYREEYQAAAIRVLNSGWYIQGPETKAFENEFAEFVGVKQCVGLNSGLDALILAIRALGIGPGDEVIVPSNTYIATVMAITINGATPIFCEPDLYYNIDSDLIPSLLTTRTKAVLVVHLYGQACRTDRIKAICDEHSLFLIEDCAQSHGTRFNGQLTGSFGDIGCFSFYPTKNLGAFGDGGAITTNSQDLADSIRELGNYGSSVKYYNNVVGVNSRLDEIQAALLRVKLQHLNDLNSERKKLAQIYDHHLVNPLIIKPEIATGADHIYHQYVIRCDERTKLQQFLETQGIGSSIHYPVPPHLSKAYQYLGYKTGDFPIAEQYADQVLSLPMFNGLAEDEVFRVAQIINQSKI
jgi:dTDP-4-amino-4,6-dideoxygalactose transaminase